ncbi:CocE/NonD family hydrolase [Nocardia sp. NPDC059091]|uniref:CocE/NonD family hydrolase n=1 Tax=unclassified Nocardia TaxID=2637762 RepID=UPI0036A5F227
MTVGGTPEKTTALSAEDLARLGAIREALLDPSPRRIGRLDQWGLADEYETYTEVAQYREVSIAGADGAKLDVALSVPLNPAPGQPYPAVILPAPPISNGYLAYLDVFPRWARNDYVVLDYSRRDPADSTGGTRVAGPQDVADAIAVVDWLAEHVDVDPDRIGFFVSSDGFGASLLSSAKDRRIKAMAKSDVPWG